MAMLLGFASITKFEVVASSIPNDSSSSSSSTSSSQSQQQQPPRGVKVRPNKASSKKQQPSILEIERAIGAGVFRERDVNSGGEGEKANMFDNILKNTVGKDEGAVEKKLRESGEWLINQTETTSRSAGKQILKTIFVWMIPLWISAFLVATGTLSLPFHAPFLDDLIS